MVVVLSLVALSSAAAPNAAAATGSISGTITGAPSHAGLAGIEACATEMNDKGETFGHEEHCVFTGFNGSYEIGSLDEGKYIVVFWPRAQGLNYLPWSYDEDGLWPTDPVSVGVGPTTGIDVELPEAGSVTGRVTEELGGKPLVGVRVCAIPQYQAVDGTCTTTDQDGRYRIVGLWTQNYTIKFSPGDSGLQYFGEYYDNQIVGNGLPSNPVPVTAGSITSGIDAALKPAAEIRGVVTAATGGAPLANIRVCTAPALSFIEPSTFAEEGRCTKTNESGAYSIGDLEGGRYKVLFSPELRDYIHWFPPLAPEDDGYPTRFWFEEDIIWNADALTLDAPTLVTGINGRLGPFPPPPLIPASPPPPETPRIAKPKCKPGRHLRKVKGKYRCVSPHPRKHRHH